MVSEGLELLSERSGTTRYGHVFEFMVGCLKLWTKVGTYVHYDDSYHWSYCSMISCTTRSL